MADQSPGAKFVASLLTGSVESIARAGAKFVESLATDAEKALKKEAERVKNVRMGAQVWRHVRLNDDLPSELQDDDVNETKKEKTR